MPDGCISHSDRDEPANYVGSALAVELDDGARHVFIARGDTIDECLYHVGRMMAMEHLRAGREILYGIR